MSEAWLDELTASEAEGIIEGLRYGIPPDRYVRRFTVGRHDQLDELEQSLSDGCEGFALLVMANYGAGKSHLLRALREMARDQHYAVAPVTVDAQGGLRFNRMDTVFAGICRALEVPDREGNGIDTLFDAFTERQFDQALSNKALELQGDISDGGRWSRADGVQSPPLFIALRAWVNAAESATVRQTVVDWLHHPEPYRSQRKLLYVRLVGSMRSRFREARNESQFYRDEAFWFHSAGHRHSWDAIADLNRIALAAGYRGLVLLFDEFEDVVQNLNNRDWQQAAFGNLFQFFSGRRFKGLSYFAVTPDFVHKCQFELLSRGVYDFPYEQFHELPSFELAPIARRDFLLLSHKIRTVHSIAFDWNAAAELDDKALGQHADQFVSNRSPDRVRQAIQALVEDLDERFDNLEY